MWTRYTSRGESGSRKSLRVEGALTKGAIGPDDAELGVETPEEAGVLLREDLAILKVLCGRFQRRPVVNSVDFQEIFNQGDVGPGG